MRNLRVRASALCVLALVGLLSGGPSQAGNLGLGIILGAPTGLSAKVKTARRSGFDAAAAWSLGKDESFHFHLDHLWQSHLFNVERQGVDLHYGIGGRMRFFDSGRESDRFSLGARVPVGLSAALNRSPVEVFFEIALVMDVVPDTDADFDAGIGVRYFF